MIALARSDGISKAMQRFAGTSLLARRFVGGDTPETAVATARRLYDDLCIKASLFYLGEYVSQPNAIGAQRRDDDRCSRAAGSGGTRRPRLDRSTGDRPHRERGTGIAERGADRLSRRGATRKWSQPRDARHGRPLHSSNQRFVSTETCWHKNWPQPSPCRLSACDTACSSSPKMRR
jgi:hypothetical protein